MTLTTWLKKLNPCFNALRWADQFPTLADAWDACGRPNWMLWLLTRAKVVQPDDPRYRLFACWCVRNTPLADGRTVWDLLTDDRSRRAVECAERHARGEADDAELAAARDAAWAVAWDIARDAAEATARPDARDAAWSNARSTAQAAVAAAWATARDAARYTAEATVRLAAWAAQSSHLRELFSSEIAVLSAEIEHASADEAVEDGAG
jgi:hypothetical protein